MTVSIDEIIYELSPCDKLAMVVRGECSGVVAIPASVEYNGVNYTVVAIGDKAFYGCDSLVKIVLPDTVTNIKSGAFWGCSSLTDILLPNTIDVLPQGLFAKCSSLKEFVVPQGITAVGYGLFYDCTSLEKVSFPASVAKLENEIFRNCNALKSIYLYCDNPPVCIADIASPEVYSNVTLHVPVGAVANYGFTRVWEKFANVEEI